MCGELRNARKDETGSAPVMFERTAANAAGRPAYSGRCNVAEVLLAVWTANAAGYRASLSSSARTRAFSIAISSAAAYPSF